MAKSRAKKRKRPGGKPAAQAGKQAAPRTGAPRTEAPPRPARPAARMPWRPWLAAAAAAAVAVIAFLVITRGGSPDHAAGGGAERPREPSAAPSTPSTPSSAPSVERLRVRVVRRLPHQRDAFTQGLVYDDGELYESTGLRGASSLRRVDLETGAVLRRRDLHKDLFAEGLALAGDHLYLLTWQEERLLVFRRADFAPVREYRYQGEGWGLCHDGRQLVMSDGTDRLRFRDPDSFTVQREVHVRLDGRPVRELNELECVDGAVWANQWGKERLLRIDPRTGAVTAVADVRGLLTDDERDGTDVMNGIAWMPDTGHFLLTGKYWPWLFEVTFEPAAKRAGR
jgi:glutaminyl-peptide cyclotransferase